MPEAAYRYDAAFSFLADDEGLATAIANELTQRLEIFVYSQRQKDLAGTDGLESFTRTFRSDSRIDVVVFREGWGQSKWTRVEETAIKERGLDEGWDFVLVISLDGKSPVWLPQTRLWFGLERFGVVGAAAVVEARITEAGGTAKEETPTQLAERLARGREANRERKARERSEGAVAAAEEAVRDLVTKIDALAKEAASIPHGMPVSFAPVPNRRFEWDLRVGRFLARICWKTVYADSIDNARLQIRGVDEIDQEEAHYSNQRVRPMLQRELEFGLDESDIWIWRAPNTKAPVLTNDGLADWLLKEMLDRAYKKADQMW